MSETEEGRKEKGVELEGRDGRTTGWLLRLLLLLRLFLLLRNQQPGGEEREGKEGVSL